VARWVFLAKGWWALSRPDWSPGHHRASHQITSCAGPARVPRVRPRHGPVYRAMPAPARSLPGRAVLVLGQKCGLRAGPSCHGLHAHIYPKLHFQSLFQCANFLQVFQHLCACELVFSKHFPKLFSCNLTTSLSRNAYGNVSHTLWH
jgi:hypothetical protein